MNTLVQSGYQSRFHIRLFAFLLGLVSILSWLTSGAGIWTMLGEFPGGPLLFNLNPYKIGVALALSSVIMLCIMAFWFAARSALVQPAMRTACLALGLLSSGVSGLLASGAYLMMLESKTAYEAVDSRRQFETIAQPLGEFASQLRQVEQQVLSFRSLTERKEQAEIQFGTSCLLKAKTGPGKRSRMRARLTGEAQGQSNLVSAVAQDASRLAQLPTQVNNTVLSQVYLQAGHMNNDRRLLELRQWVNGLLEQFETGFIDSIRGRFLCNDPQSVSALLALAKELESIAIVLPPFTPQSAPVTFAEAVGNSYAQVSSVLLYATGLSVEVPDDELLRITTLPLLIALGIEFIIIVLIVVQRALSAPLSPLSAPGRILPAAVAARIQKTVDVLESFSITEGRRTYFLVPCDGSNVDARRLANRLVRRWRLRRSAFSEPVALAAVSADYHVKLMAAAPDATRFEVWVLPRRVLRWWRAAINDLEATQEAFEETQ